VVLVWRYVGLLGYFEPNYDKIHNVMYSISLELDVTLLKI